MTDVFIKRSPCEETETQGERDMKTEAEMGVMHLQLRKAKSASKWPEERKRQGSLLPWSLQRVHSYANTLIFNLGFQSGMAFKFLFSQVT